MLEIYGKERRQHTPLLLCALVVLVSACDSATPQPAEQGQLAKLPKEQISVALYLPGMNQELNIL